jgi:hypothetical protein
VKDEVPIGRMLFERTVAVVGVALGMWLYRLWVGH